MEQEWGNTRSATSHSKAPPRPHVYLGQWNHILVQMLRQTNCEVEARLGVYGPDKRFIPGVASRESFDAIMSRLDLLGIEPLRTRSCVHIFRGGIRKTTDRVTGEIKYQKKYRHHGSSIDVHQLGVRYNISTEENIRENDVGDIRQPLLTRLRDRTSYVIPLNHKVQSTWHGLQFDLTVVHQTAPGDMMGKISYEVEIERIGSINPQSFTNAVVTLYAWSQDTEREAYVMYKEEIRQVVSVHNECFKKPYTTLYYGYQNRPVSLGIKDLQDIRLDWAITPKLDGVRKTLVISKCGVYLCQPPLDIMKIGAGIVAYHGTIMDGEFIRQDRETRVFYAFDILCSQNRDVRYARRQERMALLNDGHLMKQLRASLGESPEVKVKIKRFYEGTHFYQTVNEALAAAQILENVDKIPCDGLVFQGPGHYYSNSLKWKPPGKQTIDFKIEHLLHGHRRQFVLVVSNGRNIPSRFQGTPRFPHDGLIKISSRKWDGISGRVVECVFSASKNNFKPVKIRFDKPIPNSAVTAANIWADIKNPVTQSTMEGNSLVLFRRFCNLVKFSMLAKYTTPGCTLVDIGSGRGADMYKWQELDVGHVYAVDPDQSVLDILTTRKNALYTAPNPTIEIMNIKFEDGSYGSYGSYGCGGDNAKTTDAAVDLTVAFFSLTFFCGCQIDQVNLIHALTRCVCAGRRFIGIVLDGRLTRDNLLGKGGTNNNNNNNNNNNDDNIIIITPSFTISTEQKLDLQENCGDEITIDLADPDSMVKKQSEHLFYFEKFTEAMCASGFELETSYFLTQDPRSTSLPPDSRLLCSMMRAFVFIKQQQEL